MQAFVYHIPTRVIFGKGTEAQTAEQVKQAGAKRVFWYTAEAAQNAAACWIGFRQTLPGKALPA